MDGRPPGNPGCSRLFACQKRSFSPTPSHLPRPNSWIPPAAPAPPRAGGVGGPGPGSRCRPGLPPRCPRAPLHSHSTSRTPDDRQSLLHLGLLWLASGNPGACTDSSQSPIPHPTPCLAGDHARARTDRCAQTGHLSCSLIPWVDLCLGVGLLNHTLLPLLVPSGTSIFLSIPFHQLPFLLTMEESSLCSTSSPAFVIVRHCSEAQSDSCEVFPPWSLELSLSSH